MCELARLKSRETALASTISELQNSCDFKFLSVIGKGSFGDVVKLRNKSSGVYKAAKILLPENVSLNELQVWSRLNHKNIIQAEEVMMLLDGTMVILMPLQFKTLDKIIMDMEFRMYWRSFSYVKRWLFEVIQGVDYMHRNSLCHLDLKPNNVLISHDGIAMVCDFSSACCVSVPLTANDVAAPSIYRAPELFQKHTNTAYEGVKIDTWSLGILVVETLTNESLLDSVRICKSWRRDIQPLMRLIVSPTIFEALVKAAFPCYPFGPNSSTDALRFIDLFLRINPAARYCTSHILRHHFLKDIEMVVVDLCNVYKPCGIKKHEEFAETSCQNRCHHPVTKQENSPQIPMMVNQQAMKKRNSFLVNKPLDFLNFQRTPTYSIPLFKTPQMEPVSIFTKLWQQLAKTLSYIWPLSRLKNWLSKDDSYSSTSEEEILDAEDGDDRNNASTNSTI